MHDPLVVVFEIRRPWPTRSGFRANGKRWEWPLRKREGRPWWHRSTWWTSPFVTLFGRRFYFPSIVTVWHVEPNGHDSGEVCKRRFRRWHVHHWRLQFPPIQELCRRLFQRCAWCDGRSTKRQPVNCSHQWDAPKGPWWASKPGLYHSGCSSAESVSRSCLCEVPIVDGWNGAYGTCRSCGRYYRGEACNIGYLRAVAISGVPVKGEPWTWPRDVNVRDIKRELEAARGVAT